MFFFWQLQLQKNIFLPFILTLALVTMSTLYLWNVVLLSPIQFKILFSRILLCFPIFCICSLFFQTIAHTTLSLTFYKSKSFRSCKLLQWNSFQTNLKRLFIALVVVWATWTAENYYLYIHYNYKRIGRFQDSMCHWTRSMLWCSEKMMLHLIVFSSLKFDYNFKF